MMRSALAAMLCDVSGVEAHSQRLGGWTVRTRPAFGLRPTLRFAGAVLLTFAWVGFAIAFSAPWRSDLEEAIGPIAGWAIPILLAYIPGMIIGSLCATLLLTRYRGDAWPRLAAGSRKSLTEPSDSNPTPGCR